MTTEMIITIIVSILGGMITILLALIVYIFNGLSTKVSGFSEKMDDVVKEMKSMNDKLIGVITNQKWHYDSILELQSKVRQLEGIKFNSKQHEVES